MIFERLTIHNEVKQVLLDTLKQGRVSHAQYFQGLDGGGNLAMAVAYAQALLNEESSDMFGAVDTRASRLEHPDLHLSFPIVQSKDSHISDVHVQDFREAYNSNPYMSYKQWQLSRDEQGKKAIISKYEADSIAKKFGLRSFEGGRKVLIIWMAELMNEACANKLLKMIEEPPEGTVIIMVGSDVDALLPTIRSRVQLVRLPPLSPDAVLQVLRKNRSEPEDYLMEVAEQSEGSISFALDLLTEGIPDSSPDIIAWLRLCYAVQVKEVMTWCETQAKEGREPTLRLLERCLEMFRIAFRRNFIQETVHSNDVLDQWAGKFAPFINQSNADGLMEELDKAHSDISRNGNVRIVLLDLSFKLTRLLKSRTREN